MDFKLSNDLRGRLEMTLKGIFPEDEVSIGCDIFEKLINISESNSDFNKEYGKILNAVDVFDINEISHVIRIEGLFRKITVLKKFPLVNKNGKDCTMVDFYNMIGFYDWLNDDKVKKARSHDKVNKDNVSNDKNGDGFKLNTADVSCYLDCPYHIKSYIMVYQVRNNLAHSNLIKMNLQKMIDIITDYFTVCIDQCLKNKKLINDYYESELLDNKIDYIKFVEKPLKNIKEFNDKFLPLLWYNEQDKEFSNEIFSAVKFVGEPGMGKTTRMKKMYFDLVNEVVHKKKEMLPIWINLSELNNHSIMNLEELIKRELGDYAPHLELLLEKNKVAFFLDGYNEVFLNGLENTVKVRLANDIDNLRECYPKVVIAITDRDKNSIPKCMSQRDVQVFSFNGLNLCEIREYVKLKTNSDEEKKVFEYLDSEQSKWITDVKIIPSKLNNLIELLIDDIKPEQEDDFYDKYLDFVLEREKNVKKETRIDILIYMLRILANSFDDPDVEKSYTEIFDIWMEKCNSRIQLREINELFTLATELSILIPGNADGKYKFANSMYYYKIAMV